MKNHTINKHRGIPDFAYITFDEAYNLAENLLKSRGYATSKEFYELIGRKKTGWLGLKVKSMKVWGLVKTNKRKMELTKQFRKIQFSNDPVEILKIKKEAFLNIPLFKIIFEMYNEIGFPKKKELSKILEEKYKINPTYSSAVANTFIYSVLKYHKEDNPPITINKNIKKDLVNINIFSPIGNFDLHATNKKEFSKIMEIIEVLWDKKKVD